MRLCVVVLMSVAACKGGGSKQQASGSGSAEGSAVGSEVASGSADAFEEVSFKALEHVVALNELDDEAKKQLDPAAWPKEDAPDLDFRIDSGNAVIVHKTKVDIADAVQDVPRFHLYHVEDDPYRATAYYRGNGLDKPDDKAKYHADKYKPAVLAMARAKYVLFVFDRAAELKTPRVNTVSKEFTPGAFDAAAVLYDIEAKKLLGGFEVTATNSAEVTTHTGNYTGEELAAVMFDFEKQSRTAMEQAIKKRFPAAKPPVAVYLDLKE